MQEVIKRIHDYALEDIMGDKVEPRKEWIEENIEFTMEDDYRVS